MQRATYHSSRGLIGPLLLAGGVALGGASQAHAASGPAAASLYLEELTSPEVAAAVAAGKTTVLIPIGGTEQSGPVIALGKHNVRARFLAGRIAERLNNALVAPVIAYVPEGSIDPPSQHMRFAGTISIPDAVFEETLTAAARSFRLHGFRTIVFLGDHGGYQADLSAVAARLDRAWSPSRVRVRVLAVRQYYEAASHDFAEALRRRGYSEAQIGVHAGLADTALMLAIDANLVRSAELASPNASTSPGVEGDPRAATAALGQIGVDLIVDHSVNAIRQATREP